MKKTRQTSMTQILWVCVLSVGLVFSACSSADTQGEDSTDTEISSREMTLPAPKKDECSENDCQSGQGTFRWTNGDIYKGRFENGKRNGYGTYVWKSGAKYTGEWKDGMREGKGVYTYPNGDVYKGEFKADRRDGNGIYTYADGSVHPSKQWKNGQPIK